MRGDHCVVVLSWMLVNWIIKCSVLLLCSDCHQITSLLCSYSICLQNLVSLLSHAVPILLTTAVDALYATTLQLNYLSFILRSITDWAHLELNLQDCQYNCHKNQNIFIPCHILLFSSNNDLERQFTALLPIVLLLELVEVSVDLWWKELTKCFAI